MRVWTVSDVLVVRTGEGGDTRVSDRSGGLGPYGLEASVVTLGNAPRRPLRRSNLLECRVDLPAKRGILCAD